MNLAGEGERVEKSRGEGRIVEGRKGEKRGSTGLRCK